MNIFASDKCPIISAQNLDDKRVGKMIIETAQLLCDAAECYGIEKQIDTSRKNLYKLSTAHKNHKCALWTKSSLSNFVWLIDHYAALSNEWSYRKDSEHGAAVFVSSFKLVSYFIMDINFVSFPKTFANGTRNKDKGIDFTFMENVNDAYKCYLIARWKTDTRKPVWTKRNAPDWYEV